MTVASPEGVDGSLAFDSACPVDGNTVVMAFDRSVRRVDPSSGHLHVETSPISKVGINPYYGREIPGGVEKLGLAGDRIYNLLRDPEELQKGAKSFEGKPLMIWHRASTAQDHSHRLVAGSVGAPVTFDGTYLHAPLTVWDGDAIKGIETDAARELSSGYFYDPDMTPGEYDGRRYDGVMRNIRANHVALVDSGRAGADVMVGDAALKRPTATSSKQETQPMMTRAELLSSGALRVYLKPKMAMDQAMPDLAKLVKGAKVKTWKADKARIAASLKTLLPGLKLAQDADIEAVQEGLEQVLDQLDDVADQMNEPQPVMPPPDDQPTGDADGDAQDRIKEFLTGKLSDEDIETLLTMLKPEVDPPADPPPASGGAADADPPIPPKKDDEKDMVPKAAMDAALRRVRSDAVTETIARMNAIRAAEIEVRPLVGELSGGFKSAGEVYKMALDSASVDTTGMPEAAYGGMVRMLVQHRTEMDSLAKRGVVSSTGAHAMAMDSATVSEWEKRFPDMSRLLKR